MPNKDRYHDTVKRALQKDGWVVTGEQIRITYGDRNLWVDLRAENEGSEPIILVEVKELDEVKSAVEALASALGKYLIYRMGLEDTNTNIPLYLAVTEASYNTILATRMGQQVIERYKILLLVFNPEQEEIIQWIR